MGRPKDPLDGLEERLKNHSNALESLLALTPAREIYGSQIDDGLDPSEQWNRKKQTKEQKKAAKRAKLDPANQKSALDVIKDRERKRKRELGIDDEIGGDEDGNEDDPVPGADQKRQKLDPDSDEAEARRRAKAERRAEKRERKREKAVKRKAKDEAKRAAKRSSDVAGNLNDEQINDDDPREDLPHAKPITPTAEIDKLEISGLNGSDDEKDNHDGQSPAASTVSTPVLSSPPFDMSTNQSEASSSSSIVPPSLSDRNNLVEPETPQTSLKVATSLPSVQAASTPESKSTGATAGTSSPKLVLPDIDKAQLQERLRQRIEALRAQRKADGPDGNPAKSRQELLEQRRRKEEQRKAQKKELRHKAKEQEAERREAQLRGSGSPLSADIFSPRSPRAQDNNFSFSRLAFDDGTSADASLTGIHDPKKRKGPQDPRTALLAAEKNKARVAGFDAAKQADIAEKDLWLHAKQRANGERVRDNTSLLRKALKRQEKQKSKSEREWRDREDAVVKGKEAKQKRRETNLLKRREDKGGKAKKKPGPTKGKKKSRPGFEGRFKS